MPHTLYTHVAQKLRAFAQEEKDPARRRYAEEMAEEIDRELGIRTDQLAVAVGGAQLAIDERFAYLERAITVLHEAMEESKQDRATILGMVTDILNSIGEASR